MMQEKNNPFQQISNNLVDEQNLYNLFNQLIQNEKISVPYSNNSTVIKNNLILALITIRISIIKVFFSFLFVLIKVPNYLNILITLIKLFLLKPIDSQKTWNKIL